MQAASEPVFEYTPVTRARGAGLRLFMLCAALALCAGLLVTLWAERGHRVGPGAMQVAKEVKQGMRKVTRPLHKAFKEVRRALNP